MTNDETRPIHRDTSGRLATLTPGNPPQDDHI